MTLPAADTLAALRGRLAALDAAKLAFAPAQAIRPGPLACCGAGALPGALHEVAAKSECETPAAAGFVLPLAAAAARGRVTLWIAEDMALAENGALYGPALEDFGLAPERLIRVAVAHERDVLWAMEEACAAAASAPSIGEIRHRDDRADRQPAAVARRRTGGHGGFSPARAAGRRAVGGGDALDRARRAVGAGACSIPLGRGRRAGTSVSRATGGAARDRGSWSGTVSSSVSSSQRIVSLWLRRLSTDRIARQRSPDPRPLVVAGKRGNAEALVALDAAAERLRPAAAASRWRRRAPCIPILTSCRKTRRPTRNCSRPSPTGALRYTPLVALDAPDGLLLDIAGCAHLFGGEAALVEDLLRG